MNGMPGLTDVAHCYRRFLDREVENATVAAMQAAGARDLWELIDRVRHSPEAIRRAIGRACRDVAGIYDPLAVELEMPAGARAQLVAETVALWHRQGLGVQHRWLTRDRPRYDARSAARNRDLLFGQGAAEAGRLEALCARHRIALDAETVFVALGDEALRMADALAPRMRRYVAVEVAGAGLSAALGDIAARPLVRAEAMSLAAFLAVPCDGSFFHSVMTLQYAPPPVAQALLDACLARVRPGGHACFQLVCQLYDYRFDPVAYRAGEGGNEEGEIHALPQHHVFALLAAHGFTPLEVLPDGSAGPLGIGYTFLAHKPIDRSTAIPAM